MLTSVLAEKGLKMERVQTTRSIPLSAEEARRIKADLATQGAITTRDEFLLEYLRELNVMSVDQINRLLWAQKSQKVTYNRLVRLVGYRMISGARARRPIMQMRGLEPCRVYSLDQVGRLWLEHEVNNDPVNRLLNRDQVIHDLMVSEIFVRLTEHTRTRGEGWRFDLAGERNAAFYEQGADTPVIAPDGIGVLTQTVDGDDFSLPFFVEMDAGREGHGALSSDWGRKVVGYDRFIASGWRTHRSLRNLPSFPVAMVVTHGRQRLLNLAQAIAKKRKSGVIYYLARWNEDILPCSDIFTAPIWTVITPEGNIIGGEDALERKPLMVLE